MTAKSSKAIPFTVLVIVTIITKKVFDMNIDSEAYLLLLILLGVAGATKYTITKDDAVAKGEVDKSKLVDEIKVQL